ncbi:MAG: DUF3027 domain-containing protein [Propionibacteriaceae bacterium]|nr:DUF3027 domain-containing protein [Propionibacteriaceae bacterium]
MEAPAPAARPAKARAKKADATIAAAIDQARAAAQETAADFGVGEHLGCVCEGDYLATHYFACTHPGYPGWRWAVIMTRVPRARSATINEVVLVPADAALLAPGWVPWSERLQAGDVQPGMLLPTPENDPRLEPGFVPRDMTSDDDPAEWSQTRAVVNELGLGRERVLSAYGRDDAAQRWLAGPSGPDNQMTRLAPGTCLTCGYFVRLAGSLGSIFGACANEFSPSDGCIVAIEHGCGGHSDVVADDRGVTLPQAIFDTITTDPSLFD